MSEPPPPPPQRLAGESGDEAYARERAPVPGAGCGRVTGRRKYGARSRA
ncbi:MAG TPA: hypothetical protein VNK05_15435 [Chloroflexota bacterium]|nr:hypothetical protein [Chloroflexota bacterium]